MTIEEWIKFLVPIVIPILIPIVTGGGVFWIIYKERVDRVAREKKEKEDALKAKADATATLTRAGSDLAKDTGNIYQGIVVQLQADIKELKAEFKLKVEELQKNISDLKEELARKDNRFIRLVQAVRNSVAKRAKAIDEDCTAQRHAELDEELLNEMNSIMTEEG